jgi:hypothetical protein
MISRPAFVVHIVYRTLCEPLSDLNPAMVRLLQLWISNTLGEMQASDFSHKRRNFLLSTHEN